MRRESILVAAYLLAVTITTAISGALGPLASVIDSLPGIGLVIVIRNQLHEQWRPQACRWLTILVLMGTAGSLAANATHPRVALASGTAFLAATLAASILWNHHHRLSVVAFAVIDSLIFPWIAFGSFIVWVTTGQIAAKILGAIIWTLIFAAGSARHTTPQQE